MAHKDKRRKTSYHVRFNSSPFIGKQPMSELEPIKSTGLDSEDDEQDKSTIRPIDESPISSLQKTLKASPKMHHIPHPRRTHQKSASYTMDNLAELARRNSDSSRPNYGSDGDDDDYKHNGITNGFNNFHLKKFSKKEQEELMSIQINLKKWIGNQQSLILPKFLDLMEKIAPHVSTEESTEMFNKMDPFNNGQIKTNILLHDEFLPRMILVRFLQK